MTDLIRGRPLTAVFLLAFLGSWVGWSPWWLSRSGIGLLPFQLPFAAIAGINQMGLFAGPPRLVPPRLVRHPPGNCSRILLAPGTSLALEGGLAAALAGNGSRGYVLLVILGHNGINWALFAVGTLSGQAVATNWPTALGLAGLAAVAWP